LVKGIPVLSNTREAYYFSELENTNIGNVDVSEGEIVFRKSYSVTVASNGLTSTLESDTDITLEHLTKKTTL
jgi:hypothetical protein